jgi:beta-N-acetylhexosaminidase
MTAPTIHPGRLVMVDVEGTHLDAATAAFLRQQRIRAVCLFRKNLGSEAEIRQLTAHLRDAMGDGALIAMDQEGGSVVRATSLPQAPGAMALGAVGDEALAEEVGAAIARGLKHLGVNWNFAPVLDVNNNPANPVIAERSFGSDPQAVVRLAGAWMRGAAREGVACCVKHFPGHGDTHMDSHHALPVVDKSLAELEALELVPFRALAGEAPSLMTAHIVYPQLDDERPATLSPALLNGVLRERLGYDGVVITDALMMQAVHERWGPARAAVMALAAGADMPLAQGTREEQLAVLAAIEAAQAGGTLDAQRLARSAARLDALAARFPATPRELSPTQRAADETLMRVGHARALTSLRGARPPARDARLRVVTQSRVPSDGVSEAGISATLVRALFASHDDVEFVELDDLAAVGPETLQGRDGRQVVLASNIRARYAQGGRLHADLHLALWNPFQALDVDAPTVITWGYATGALGALRAWIDGRADAPGRAPVTLTPTRQGAAA